MTCIKDKILNLEKQLMQKEYRLNKEFIDKHLHDRFIETDGVNKWSKEDIMKLFEFESSEKLFVARSFSFKSHGSEKFTVSYIVEKFEHENVSTSKRVSTWIVHNGSYQMILHEIEYSL